MGKKKSPKGHQGQKNQAGDGASGSQTPSTSQSQSAETKKTPTCKDVVYLEARVQKLSLEMQGVKQDATFQGKGRGQGRGSSSEIRHAPNQQSIGHRIPDKPRPSGSQQQSFLQGGLPPAVLHQQRLETPQEIPPQQRLPQSEQPTLPPPQQQRFPQGGQQTHPPHQQRFPQCEQQPLPQPQQQMYLQGAQQTLAPPQQQIFPQGGQQVLPPPELQRFPQGEQQTLPPPQQQRFIQGGQQILPPPQPHNFTQGGRHAFPPPQQQRFPQGEQQTLPPYQQRFPQGEQQPLSPPQQQNIPQGRQQTLPPPQQQRFPQGRQHELSSPQQQRFPQGGQQTLPPYQQRIPQREQQPLSSPQQERIPQSGQQAPRPHQQQKVPQGKQQPLSAPQQRIPQSTRQELQPPQQIPQGVQTTPTDLKLSLRNKLHSGGTRGRRIMIETNHLALLLKKLEIAIHYDVVIEPDKPKKLLRVVMEQFRRQYYPDRYPAFDGTRNLYSSSRLPFGDSITGEVNILQDERQRTYNIKIQYANEIDLSCLVQYFESPGNVHMVTPQEAIQCIDIVLRNAPSLYCIPAGRSFFTKPSPQRMVDLEEGMEMYHGFYQSAVLGWRPFLNVDVSHKAFPKEMPVLDVILELTDRYYKLEERLVHQNFEMVNRFMTSLNVKYEIPNQPNTRRVFRVNTLDRPANECRFRNENNIEMTVSAYFERFKHVRLQYPHLPCLWVGARQREPKIMLPIEFCTIMAAQVTNRTMTPNQTKIMTRSAATTTNVRKAKIMDSIRQANYGSDPCAQEFGISVNEEFTKVQARVLPSPSLQYRNVVPVRNGEWRASTFYKPHELDIWAIVCLNERTRPQELHQLANMMIQEGNRLGMTISQPQIIPLPRLKTGKEKQTIEQEFRKLISCKLILVVLPDMKYIYAFVKQVAELIVGVITQCVKSKTLLRLNQSTVSNILLKVNAKINGLNHKLEITPPCLKEPCMIMGADVTHPSPESRGNTPSVAAVTASHDSSAFKYNITCRLQQSTQEIISDLANIVCEQLRYFENQNKRKPLRIIFFRDGVSDGQFETVVNSEVRAVKQACQMIDPSGKYKPKLTFLVVQKRHHTRFFPTNSKDSEGKNNNVPAGTVVDTEITHPTGLDFYLVSHASILGVARPTKYRKLMDENDMQEDELEELTYHLCHMFARCTRSVSYPAPTYYAHLAAARAKAYCEKQNINMSNLESAQQAYLNVKPEVIQGNPMYFV